MWPMFGSPRTSFFLALIGNIIFSLKLVHLYRLTVDHGLVYRGGPANHLTGSLLANLCFLEPVLCSDFLSDLSFSRYVLLEWIWRHGLFNTMWLSELEIFAMFWGLKNYSMTETDILWYGLHEYMCYYSFDLYISSPLLTWQCLASIMNYPLCMTHDLATAHLHDYAWTAK